MLELETAIDIDAFVERVRSLWREAAGRATSLGVELFAKAAVRVRATRDLDRTSVTIDRAFESGLAVRVMGAGRDHAGFAAASGVSGALVGWVVDTASSFDARAPLSAPGRSDRIEAERWDLDPATALPSEAMLTTGVIARPDVEWVEAGTTNEVLIGKDGWLAARRRHRLWALGSGHDARLVAQRGFTGWEHLVDVLGDDDSCRAASGDSDLGVLVLTPHAATSVVAALVDEFHGSTSRGPTEIGDGWEVIDEPVRSDGLAGGSFDDAGFPAGARCLAGDGIWLGRLSGPGTLRRASFREPPSETATNLVVPPGDDGQLPRRTAVAQRCRVVRVSSELWVLELDIVNRTAPRGFQRRWVRVHPGSLLAACVSRLGRSTVTPTGPIVPALQFEGLISS